MQYNFNTLLETKKFKTLLFNFLESSYNIM